MLSPAQMTDLSTYNRLTVEDVKGLMEKFGVGLVRQSYGFYENPASPYYNCGCGISMAILRQTQNVAETREVISGTKMVYDKGGQLVGGRIDRWSELTSMPPDYLVGLMCGLDYDEPTPKLDRQDYNDGVADGQALKELIK